MVLQRYAGSEETLLLAFDIGTTQSAVTITHLIPRQVPVILTVNSWPDNFESAKLPTILAYNKGGGLEAVGASAASEDIYLRTLEEGVVQIREFKLLLHPASMPSPQFKLQVTENDSTSTTSFELPTLPKFVTIQKCYNDYLNYLFIHAKNWYFKASADGNIIWNKLINKSQISFAHPNGWGLREQSVLRNSVIAAGILNESEVKNRLHFVSEGEASVHFGLEYARLTVTQWLEANHTVAVVDAGGSTVDISVYKVTKSTPKLELKELGKTACTQSGGIFVNKQFEHLLNIKLANSKYQTFDFIKDMTAAFESNIKLTFDAKESSYRVKFGQNRDNDLPSGIDRGRLILSSEEVESTFIPCIEAIKESLTDQLKLASVDYILLVGGFGESPYLGRILTEEFGSETTKVVTVFEPTKKAVAVGAALFFVQDSVKARACRYEFGIDVAHCFNIVSQSAGSRRTVIDASGEKRILGGWSTIVQNSSIHDVDSCIRNRYYFTSELEEITYRDNLRTIILYAYDGDSIDLEEWMTDALGNEYPGFSKCCEITVDLSTLYESSPSICSKINKKYYKRVAFQVGIYFGTSTLSAKMFWDVNGVEHESDASIVPSQFF